LGKVEFLAGGAQYGTTYWYDGVDRLTREKRRICCGATDYDTSYGYDQVGNRTSRTRDGSTVTYTYDNNDKLTSANDGSSFGYDGAGNMTSVSGPLGSWMLTYDDAGRLSQVIYPTGTDTFVYNALGERMRLTVNGVVTRYVYHGDRVLEETDDAGVVQVRYATANGSYYAPLLQRWTGVSRFPGAGPG
jgi:YD repeat-containing protein